MLLKFKIYILAHKFIVVVVLLVAFYGGYRGYKTLTDTSSEIRYVFGEVKKQTIIASIQGSGQVSASNQVDIQPKASGEITALSVTLGQEVGAGALLATIDASDALRAVRDAETALETAKLELDKTLEPLDELTLLQAENSLAQAKNAKQNAEDNITKAYEDGFNTVSNAFLVLPNVMAGLADILFGSNAGLDSTTQNIDYYARVSRLYDEVKAEHYRTDAETTDLIARAAYDQSFGNYTLTNRASGAPVIEVLVVESYGAVRDIAEAVKSTT
ncbi:MAG: biotin/lipoyl-binding protein, partial [bacterium]|nr:biotin/lipoyl-binding protein [bacterium]